MTLIRVKVSFDRVNSKHARAQNSWLLIDLSSCRIIADLEHMIKERFQIGKSCLLTLLLDDFVLPAQERVEILRDNDTVRVQQAVSSNKGGKITKRKRPPSSSSGTASELMSSSDDRTQEVKMMKFEKQQFVSKLPSQPILCPSSSSSSSSDSESDSEDVGQMVPQRPGAAVQQKNPEDSSGLKECNVLKKDNIPQANGLSPNIAEKQSTMKKSSTAKKTCETKTTSSSSDTSESSSSETSTEDDNQSKTTSSRHGESGEGKNIINTPRTHSISSPTVLINNSAVFSKDYDDLKSTKTTENNQTNESRNNSAASRRKPEPKINNSSPQKALPARSFGNKGSSADKSVSQQHIRFDEEEEEEKEDDLRNGSAIMNNTRSNVCAEPQASDSIQRVEKDSGNNIPKDYAKCELLHGAPRVGDRVAYKILELSESYTPEISQYKEGKVLSYDPSVQAIVLELTEHSLQRSKGDGTLSRRFEMEEDEDESELKELDKRVTVCWSEMVEPRLVV